LEKKRAPCWVLVTIAANIGDTAVLDYPACFTDSVVGLIPKAGVEARFLELMMRAQKQHLNDIAPQMAQKNINIEILKPIKVPVPTLAEQKRIVAAVEKLEATITEAQAVIDAAPARKQVIMQKYL
jgi:type I restriction enzyme S subunit